MKKKFIFAAILLGLSSSFISVYAENSEDDPVLSASNLSSYAVFDYVTLGEYKGLKVEAAPVEVTYEEIFRRIEEQDVLNTVVADMEMTVSEYIDAVRQSLQQEKEELLESELKEKLLALVYENATIHAYPQEVFAYSVDNAKSYYAAIAEYSKMSLGEYLESQGMSEDSFIAQISSLAENALRQEMILLAVFETEGMEITDEEYQTGLAAYADLMGSEPAAVEKAYGKAYIIRSLAQEEAMQFIYDQANIVDVTEEAIAETETEIKSETPDAQTEIETESESETPDAETEIETESASETPDAQTEIETESESETPDAQTESAADVSETETKE